MHKDIASTPFIEVFGHKFCAWCLSPMKYDSWYEDSYYHCEANYCDCALAVDWFYLKKNADEAKEDLSIQERKGYLYCENRSKKEFKLWEAKKKVEILSKEIILLQELNNKG